MRRRQFQRVVELRPADAKGRNDLGAALLAQRRFTEAMAQFRQALRIKPDYAKARYNLGLALAASERFDEALAEWERALQIKPDDADLQNHVAWLRATCPQTSLRNGAEAIEHARRADQLCGGKQLDVLDCLAASYAEAGRFPEALATVRKALALATAEKNRAWVDILRTRNALYEAGKPLRQAPSSRSSASPKPSD